MRIPLPRGRFVILHPLRMGLVVGLVGLLVWAVGAFGAAPAAAEPQVVVPTIVDLPVDGGSELFIPFVMVELPADALVSANVAAPDLHE